MMTLTNLAQILVVCQANYAIGMTVYLTWRYYHEKLQHLSRLSRHIPWMAASYIMIMLVPLSRIYDGTQDAWRVGVSVVAFALGDVALMLLWRDMTRHIAEKRE
jgi:hypothetical protein